jgi:hypothetical protein
LKGAEATSWLGSHAPAKDTWALHKKQRLHVSECAVSRTCSEPLKLHGFEKRNTLMDPDSLGEGRQSQERKKIRFAVSGWGVLWSGVLDPVEVWSKFFMPIFCDWNGWEAAADRQFSLSPALQRLSTSRDEVIQSREQWRSKQCVDKIVQFFFEKGFSFFSDETFSDQQKWKAPTWTGTWPSPPWRGWDPFASGPFFTVSLFLKKTQSGLRSELLNRYMLYKCAQHVIDTPYRECNM